MKRFAILACLLTGCASAPTDGVRVIWHRMDSETMTMTSGDRRAFNVKGFAKKVDGVCHVWAPDSPVTVVNGKRVIDEARMATLGHEIKHCFDGSFHD